MRVYEANLFNEANRVKEVLFTLAGKSDHKIGSKVGIRNIFYRIATITGQGLLIVLAGMLEKWTGNIPYAWSLVFFVCAGLFIAIGLYHSYQLPKPTADKGASLGNLGHLFKTFFQSSINFSAVQHH